MPVRASLLFAVTTNPQDRTVASPHSGGWSESHWQGGPTLLINFITDLASKRAPLLPNQCSIIGYRSEVFTIVGNKLLPGGTSGGRFLYPGGMGTDLNLPQDALMCNGQGQGVINAVRFNIRGLPDSQIMNGEYQPTRAYKTAVDTFFSPLVQAGWGFVGRVKTNPSARVLSIDATGIVKLSANVGGGNNDFLRMNRCYDVNGNPIKGAFPIANVAANVYTLVGYTGQVMNKPSGTARLDAIAFYRYGSVSANRAVARKIGRPFEQYRGRASKLRV